MDVLSTLAAAVLVGAGTPGSPPSGDTLTVRSAPVTDAPQERERLEEILVAVTRTLRSMNVIERSRATYCLVLEPAYDLPGIRTAVEAELPQAWPPVQAGETGPGCERDARSRRYRIEHVAPAGDDGAVVRVSGDHLPRWPPGVRGLSFPGWTARCEVPGPERVEEQPRCSPAPLDVRAGAAAWPWPGLGPFEEPVPVDEMEIFVEVAGQGAHRVHAIRAPAGTIPVLPERSAYLPDVRWCDRGFGWSVRAEEPSGEEYVFLLRPPVVAGPRGMVSVAAVAPPVETEFRGIRCEDTAAVEGPAAVFSLGGVGTPHPGPVHVCPVEPGCPRPLELDPGRHELAAEPHAHFRWGDLEEGVGEGRGMQLRVRTQRFLPGLHAFAVIQETPEALPRALFLHASDGRDFWISVLRPTPYPPDTELRVYLFLEEGR
jgi:hypothetical protein